MNVVLTEIEKAVIGFACDEWIVENLKKVLMESPNTSLSMI